MGFFSWEEQMVRPLERRLPSDDELINIANRLEELKNNKDLEYLSFVAGTCLVLIEDLRARSERWWKHEQRIKALEERLSE